MDILILSLALSADAFGAALALGMRRIGLWKIIVISFTVGLMHVIMPLISMTAGNELQEIFGRALFSAGGVILVLTGLQMVLSLLKDESNVKQPAGIGIVFFSLGVSMDSFSTGLSLGVIGVDQMAAVLCFGLSSAIFTMTGLMLSRRIGALAGKAGEAAGGAVLMFIGIKWLLSL
ncbi:manganese efflux pump MntP [Domibacillus epiphyticus]|nr:manganese efflux pump [Domibacillus epiphyticus]